MKKHWVVIILIFVITSCKIVYHTVPRYLKNKGFTLRYIEKTSELGEKLNINGVFILMDSLNPENGHYYYETMIFFEDGMYVSNFYNNISEPLSLLPQYIEGVIKCSAEIEYHSFYIHSKWGYYEVEDKVIKVQVIDRPLLGGMDSRWYADEVWYEILDTNTIRQIESFPIHKTTNWEFSYYKKFSDRWRNIESNFIPLSSKPHSDGWLKNEKWFWSEKEKYNPWMESKHK